MTAAREEILARIGAALAPVTDAGGSPVTEPTGGSPITEPTGGSPAAGIPRRYRRAGAGGKPTGPAGPELVDLLVDRLVDYRAAVSRCRPAGVAELLAQRLSEHGIESVLVPGGFPERWLSATGARRRTDEALTPVQLDQIDGVLCTCALAIAETGTIVLDGGPGQGRRALSLVPDYLLIVLATDQVVAGVPEAVARLDPDRPLTWISGPSATSDIELNRVEGVHGPRTLDVLLIDSDGATA
ncbi:LutC/YkgG family protein [Jatrophihabitans sp.]|jgi:L-lactate dehydrogenase complex protein LldG|uniref:LutC/YkgG family protein n=1 Tax=Jatrophihabitans sp. TaxID=1932789 RepID=UPI002F246C65